MMRFGASNGEASVGSVGSMGSTDSQSKKRAFYKKMVVLAAVALCGLFVVDVDFSSFRLLQDAKCDVYFNHMYSQYSDWTYWEGLYGKVTQYYGDGPYGPTVPRDPNNVGYVLTLFTCPTEVPDDSSVEVSPDPGHSFYDAAAVLKYSIERNSKPNAPKGATKYGATMYAIVHEDAIRCEGPNGEEYDRVKVLQDLGYHVNIAGSPFGPYQIQDRFLRESLDELAFKELIRLYAFDYNWHRIVVMVDFTTLMLKPIDDVYEQFLADDDLVVQGTNDYPTTFPFIGGNMGLNLHWLMIKPDPSARYMLLDTYKNATYSEEFGWEDGGIRNFDGVLGMKGFLRHFFTRVAPFGSLITLERCSYGNDNSDPMGWNGKEMVCKDEGSCDDCREMDFENDVSVIKMLGTCGDPWKCSWDDSWDNTTKTACATMHRTWFSTRVEFEESCWHNGPSSTRTGQYHSEVFRGFCHGPGMTQYNRMIDDAGALAVCDSTAQTAVGEERVFVGFGEYQNQKLTLTTGEVTGSVTGCVSGTISSKGSSAMKGEVVAFGVAVNGVPQGGIDKTNVMKTAQGYKYGTYVVTDFNPKYGNVNTVAASVLMDYDGDLSTTADQITITATAKVTGKLS